MANDHALKEILRPVARAVHPTEDLRRKRAMETAFNDDGSINPEAIRNALPLQVLGWWLPGASASGVNVSEEYRIPSAIRIKRIDAFAKIAPNAATLIARITVNGGEAERVTVSKGATSGVSITDYPVAAGSVVRLDIVQAAGSNLSIQISYAPDTGGNP